MGGDVREEDVGVDEVSCVELELVFDSQEESREDAHEGAGGDSEEIEMDYTTDPSLEEANQVMMLPPPSHQHHHTHTQTH